MREARFWDEWKSRFRDERFRYITPDNPEVERAARRAKVSGGTDKEQALSAWQYVYKRTAYKLSKEWKTPAQTLRERVGDCEDVTFLIASMLANMGVSDIKVVIGELIFPSGKVELHTWVEVNGMAVDATGSPDIAGKVTYEPVKKYRI